MRPGSGDERVGVLRHVAEVPPEVVEVIHCLLHSGGDLRRDLDHRLEKLRLDALLLLPALEGEQDLIDPRDELVTLAVQDLELLFDAETEGSALAEVLLHRATIAAVQAGFVDAGGTRLFVRRWGDEGRPAVLYWHGGGGGSNEWPHLASALEAAGYTLYAPDAPGYGESPSVEFHRYRTSVVADLAVALVDELGIAPVVWAGYSWGGNVGIHAVARAPNRFRGLALLDGGYFL